MQQAAAAAALLCKGVCLGSDAETVTLSCRMQFICAEYQGIAVYNGGGTGLMPLPYNYI